MRNTFVCTAAFFFLLLPAAVTSQSRSTLAEFYQTADTVARYPYVDRKLAVVCQKQIGANYCTFIGYEGETRPFIAAVTAKPLTDPNTEIARSVVFREILPTAGKTTTWGYIFDRNNDGAIDYLELVEGAGATEPANFPSTFPVRRKHLKPKELEYFVEHCSIVFSHWADENFDGRIDAAVIPELDAKRDWIQRRLFFRSSEANDSLDEAWGFRQGIGGKKEKVQLKAGSASYLTLTNKQQKFSGATLAAKTGLLILINQAAGQCGLGPGSFPAR